MVGRGINLAIACLELWRIAGSLHWAFRWGTSAGWRRSTLGTRRRPAPHGGLRPGPPPCNRTGPGSALQAKPDSWLDPWPPPAAGRGTLWRDGGPRHFVRVGDFVADVVADHQPI